LEVSGAVLERDCLDVIESCHDLERLSLEVAAKDASRLARFQGLKRLTFTVRDEEDEQEEDDDQGPSNVAGLVRVLASLPHLQHLHLSTDADTPVATITSVLHVLRLVSCFKIFRVICHGCGPSPNSKTSRSEAETETETKPATWKPSEPAQLWDTLDGRLIKRTDDPRWEI